MINFYLQSKKMKQIIIDNYGYLCCEVCGGSGGKFECHHIVYRSEAPNHENLHNERNLIVVCKSDHDFLHEKKSRRNGLVVQRRLWELFPEYLREEEFNN